MVVGVERQQGEADDGVALGPGPAGPQTRRAHRLAVDARDACGARFTFAPVVFKKCCHRHNAALAFDPRVVKSAGGGDGLGLGVDQLG